MDREIDRLKREIQDNLDNLLKSRKAGNQYEWLSTYVLGQKSALETITGKEFSVSNFELKEVV